MAFVVVLVPFVSGSAFCRAAHGQHIDFASQVQPILAKHCFACHGPDEAEGGLRLTTREEAFAETESGNHAIVAGNLEESVLLERITTEDEFERMPPEGDPLTNNEIDVIRQWIEQGADWSEHWAFVPMKPQTVPSIENDPWSVNPIDAFVYDRLQRAGLQPNRPATREQLIRRAYYDLTGLPPTAEEIATFANDPDPNAFSNLVDRLLDSPHYGERWGRHYLDLVRYAETNSFERDGAKPNAWKYRDYVIRSFNEDKPYDQFVIEQLAGDELEDVKPPRSIIATGYLPARANGTTNRLIAVQASVRRRWTT